MDNQYSFGAGSAHNWRPSSNAQDYQAARMYGNLPPNVGSHLGMYNAYNQSVPLPQNHHDTQAPGMIASGFNVGQRTRVHSTSLFVGTNQAAPGGCGILPYPGDQSGEVAGRMLPSESSHMHQGTENPYGPNLHSTSGPRVHMHPPLFKAAIGQAFQGGPSLPQYSAGQPGRMDGHAQLSPPAIANQATQNDHGVVARISAKSETDGVADQERPSEFAYLAETTQDKTARSNEQTENGLGEFSTRKATLRLHKTAKDRYSHVIKPGNQLLGRRIQHEFSCKFCPQVCSHGDAFRNHLCRKHNLVAPSLKDKYSKCPSCGAWDKKGGRRTMICGDGGRKHKKLEDKTKWQCLEFLSKSDRFWTRAETQEVADIFCLGKNVDKKWRYRVWEVVKPEYYELSDREDLSLPVPVDGCKDLLRPSESSPANKKSEPPRSNGTMPYSSPEFSHGFDHMANNQGNGQYYLLASTSSFVPERSTTDQMLSLHQTMSMRYSDEQNSPTSMPPTGETFGHNGHSGYGYGDLNPMAPAQGDLQYADPGFSASTGLNETDTMLPAAENGANVFSPTTGNIGLEEVSISDLVDEFMQSDLAELWASE